MAEIIKHGNTPKGDDSYLVVKYKNGITWTIDNEM